MHYKTGTYKVARQKGILKEYASFLVLKDIYDSSFIRRGELEKVSLSLGYSYTYLISKILPVLVKKGFIEKLFKNDKFWGYRLVSYKQAFGLLKTRRSDMIRFKNSITNVREFLSVLEALEINNNFEKQLERKFTKNHICKLEYHFNKGNKERTFSLLEEYKNRFLKEARCFYNTDDPKRAKISCFGVSKLLGFNSAMKGCRVIKSLSEKKVIDKQNKSICVANDISYTDARSGFDFRKHFYVKESKSVFERLVSDITFCKDFLALNIKNRQSFTLSKIESILQTM